jgi:DNA mismatch repair protein MutL
MGRIRVLDQWLADRIAAGEVVERPASVVKELVENALDAGARSITVEIEEGGFTCIRVCDDGEGMDPEDAVLALRRFATSKITRPDDLHRITTLGFRGEALPSIAAVSLVELVTCDGQRATRVRAEGGRIVGVEEVGAPRGTVVTVRRLFYNTPARRNFLRSPGREAALCAEAVSAHALSNPHVAFRFIRDGEEVLWLAPTDPRRRAAQVLGVQPEELLPIPEVPGEVRVGGFVGVPEVARKTRSAQYFFTNRRPITTALLLRALEEGTRTLIPTGLHPVCVLAVSLPPHAVDPNVHPRKLEVRFREEDRVFRAVSFGVREAYRVGLRTLPLPRGPDGPTGPPVVQEGLLREAVETWTAPTPQEVRPGRSSLRVLGQVLRTYIVADSPEGLVLVDQHAAHERVLYEGLRRRMRDGTGSQVLAQPIEVELTTSESELVEAHLKALEGVGFGLERFGGTTYLVRSAPEGTVAQNPVRLLRACLHDLATGGRVRSVEEALDRVAQAVACHTAVRSGDPLSVAEMEALLASLGACEDPATCFHGRPTMVVIPQKRLETWFLRR